MKIEVEVSDLKDIAGVLRRAEGDIERMQSELKRKMNGLTLESRRRSDIDSTFRTISSKLDEIQRELEELAKFSANKGGEFKEADGKGKPLISKGVWKFIKSAASVALDFVPIIGNAKGLIEAVTGSPVRSWRLGSGHWGRWGQ